MKHLLTLTVLAVVLFPVGSKGMDLPRLTEATHSFRSAAEAAIEALDAKGRKAMAKVLDRLAEPPADLGEGLQTLKKIVKPAGKALAGNEELSSLRDALEGMVDAAGLDVEAYAAAVARNLGFPDVERNGPHEKGGSKGVQEKAAEFLARAREISLNDPTLPSPWLTADVKRLLAAYRLIGKADRKLAKWLGKQGCPGRPFGEGESAGFEGFTVIDGVTTDFFTAGNRAAVGLDAGPPATLRILVAACGGDGPNLAVELLVREDPELDRGIVGTHEADGSPSATAAARIFGPGGYPDAGRDAIGTVSIQSLDVESGRVSGFFDITFDLAGVDGFAVQVSGSFDGLEFPVD